MNPKPLIKIVAIGLTCWLVSPILRAQVGGEVETFNRSLGLEDLGSDLVGVEQALEHGKISGQDASVSDGSGIRKARIKRAGPNVLDSFNNLTYHTDPAITANVRAALGDTKDEPFDARTYDALISRFDRRFDGYGFSRYNVGDTLAGFLIISWEILHNSNASQHPAGIRRIRQAVCVIIERKGKVASLSNGSKQIDSEVMKIGIEILSEKAHDLRQSGDRYLLEAVNKGPLQFGLDLRRMELTDQGFVNG